MASNKKNYCAAASQSVQSLGRLLHQRTNPSISSPELLPMNAVSLSGKLLHGEDNSIPGSVPDAFK